MADDINLLELCTVWKLPCIKDKCISYEVHTKQRFKNVKTGKYIPIDQLDFYTMMSQEQLDDTIERQVTIVHECRKFGKIIQIENFVDHQIPSE